MLRAATPARRKSLKNRTARTILTNPKRTGSRGKEKMITAKFKGCLRTYPTRGRVRDANGKLKDEDRPNHPVRYLNPGETRVFLQRDCKRDGDNAPVSTAISSTRFRLRDSDSPLVSGISRSLPFPGPTGFGPVRAFRLHPASARRTRRSSGVRRASNRTFRKACS